MKVISLSAFEELKSLHIAGFTSELTKSPDGSEIILAKNSDGLTRIFTVHTIEEDIVNGRKRECSNS